MFVFLPIPRQLIFPTVVTSHQPSNDMDDFVLSQQLALEFHSGGGAALFGRFLWHCDLKMDHWSPVWPWCWGPRGGQSCPVTPWKIGTAFQKRGEMEDDRERENEQEESEKGAVAGKWRCQLSLMVMRWPTHTSIGRWCLLCYYSSSQLGYGNPSCHTCAPQTSDCLKSLYPSFVVSVRCGEMQSSPLCCVYIERD